MKDSFALCERVLYKSVKFLESSSLSKDDQKRRIVELESYKSLYTYLKVELNLLLHNDLNISKIVEEMLKCSVISFQIIQALGFSLKQRKKYASACILFREYLGLCE